MAKARTLLRSGPATLHHQVYVDLKTAIEEGRYAHGDRLPPERDLAQQYGCSLITVRRALAELAREQRIERTQGRGTFVLRPRIDRDLGDTNSFNEEMARLGLIPETRVLSARSEAAGESVAKALELQPGSPTLHLERLRLASGEPLLLEIVSLPAERFPGLLASDLERGSLYELLSQRYGTEITSARETLEPVLLRMREARLLGQKTRTPALLVEGLAYTSSNVPVEFSRTYVRGDRTRYYVQRVVVREGARPSDRPTQPARGRGQQVAAATSARG
ncbi:MAG TPA: GntR family transcriptional regulator [Candidatus Limnocylindrales bacterium]|nr:GntR family transcriptional regulator [Candidatus Limnocylindrales bacterium]